jgi:prepilin-type N-terminal cleavage/methylation domain-containing protein
MPAPAAFWKVQRGFTLFEMLIVVALVMIGSGVAIPVSMRMVHNAKGDSAAAMAATFLQSARNRAVAERRNIVLTFPTNNTMQIERIEVPSGTRTVLERLMLEGEEEFVRDAALPDTPDRFGGTTAIYFTGVEPVMFTSDGSLIDSAGDVTNGNVFIVRPHFLETARAVTITGVTGLVRAWKWQGASWMQ